MASEWFFPRGIHAASAPVWAFAEVITLTATNGRAVPTASGRSPKRRDCRASLEMTDAEQRDDGRGRCDAHRDSNDSGAGFETRPGRRSWRFAVLG